MKYEKKRGVKDDSEAFGLRSWKEGVVVIKRGGLEFREAGVGIPFWTGAISDISWTQKLTRKC